MEDKDRRAENETPLRTFITHSYRYGPKGPFFYLASGRSRRNMQNILQQICLESCLWIISVMRKTSKCHFLINKNIQTLFLSTTRQPSLQSDMPKKTKTTKKV